ncbi:hypothetical protein [Echinicola vietnamensis]|uniref:hypothetical protein n=1 Tax=Echinicola vietnamensis TaxID=390884 RepID=UPI00059FEF08|nr:hypothetical protein [Echinicola vietnamensis]
MSRFVITFLIWAICYATCLAQVSRPDTIYAFFSSAPTQVDGQLNDPAWQQAISISNFTQRELNIGEPATERTEVAIVYTTKTLYIGFRGYDSEPGKLVAREMKRDFDFDLEDNFEVIIDTYK